VIDITNGVDMTQTIVEGITFGDLISKNEGMHLIERSAPSPSEKEIIESVAFMQGVHDFSMMMGERVFENRSISYTFHLIEKESSYRKFDQRQIENSLMKKGITKLNDTYSPGYYYMGKCVSVETEDDHVYGRLIVTIEFDCYPFKIKEANEGSLFWDDYDVSDYYQETSFKLRRTTFKSLAIGQVGTVGAWSTQYDGLERIPKQLLGKSYVITDKQVTDQSVSNYSYYLTGLNKWVLEQDIVEAQNGAQQIDLYNNGTASIVPKVTTTGSITIIRENEVFNLFAGVVESDLFRLNEGHNYLLLASGTASDVNFNFHKELI